MNDARGWQLDADEVAAAPAFEAALPALAARTGLDVAALRRRLRRDLHELRTGHSPWLHRLNARAGRALCRRGYEAIDYDPRQVQRMRVLFDAQPAIVLSSHKSYLDGGAINVGFHDHGLPPLTGFAGANMAFWPLGAWWRRANGVFIRRAGGDPAYAFALRQQLGALLERRRPLQWFIEGTRSRTGKLGPPRLGLLVYAVDAWREGRCEDLQLVPIAVAYDQLRESEEYAAQARGAPKAPETLGWLLRFVRGQRGRFGRIYVRFGEPLSLRAALGAPGELPAADTPQYQHLLRRLAFEASSRINRAMPITAAALLTLALLAARGRALTVAQLRIALRGYLAHAQAHGHELLPGARRLETDEGVGAALAALRESGLAESIAGFDAAVHRIRAGRELQAAYYRNTVVHHFLEGAVAELALLAAVRAPPGERLAALRAEAVALRDLLEFEFYFPQAEAWSEAVLGELDRLAPGWLQRLERGDDGAGILLGEMPTLGSDTLLRPFVESQLIVAETLLAAGRDAGVDRDAAAPEGDALLAAALVLGEQYLAQRRVHHAEAVSTHLFVAAERLVRRRGLLAGQPGVDARRRQFAAGLRELLARMDAVRRIAVRRVAHDLARGI